MKKQIMTWMRILLLVLAGCADEKNNHLLAGAEACMETCPDSARRLLSQVDSVLTHEQQARYACCGHRHSTNVIFLSGTIR